MAFVSKVCLLRSSLYGILGFMKIKLCRRIILLICIFFLKMISLDKVSYILTGKCDFVSYTPLFLIKFYLKRTMHYKYE
jgi:hypothetical protein